MKNMKTKLGTMVLTSLVMAMSAPAAIVAITNTFSNVLSMKGWYDLRGNNNVKYVRGSEPGFDYWDGDDSVAQSARGSSESNAVVAAGGVITGDGLLADGALRFDVRDGTPGNEYMAFNLGGTMEAGETITFSYSVFNNDDYYSYTQGRLWDVTTGKQLAAPHATPQNKHGWTKVLATSDVAYKPHDWSVSYTATAAEEGHQLAIVFCEWANSSRRDSCIDYIRVTSKVPAKSMRNTR